MSEATFPAVIERLQFFPGQRLLAGDLSNLESFNRQMRWLHNRSLHQPGVAGGFAITGRKGDRVVSVGPGYAIDASGREIVLTQTITIEVPPLKGSPDGGPVFLDLAVSYPDAEDLETTETRRGFCEGAGAVRRREEPDFVWVNARQKDPLLDDVLTARRIALGRAEVLGCKLNRDISLERRRNAKPAPEPYVAGGSAGPEAWTFEHPPTAFGIEINAKIDTSDAGFRAPPHYHVSVRGNRQLAFENGSTVLIDGFVRIADPSVSGFSVSMLLPSMLLSLSGVKLETVLNEIRRKRPEWWIDWIGVEG